VFVRIPEGTTSKNSVIPKRNYFCMTFTGILTLRKEHRLRVFENRGLRRIFGSEGKQMMGRWRKSHNGKPYDLYSSQNIYKGDKIMGALNRNQEWALVNMVINRDIGFSDQ
jgi:hypothetical protein